MHTKPAATRRQFIATSTAAAAAFSIVPRHVLGGSRFVAPSDKVNVAIIGAGGQGRTNARALFQEEDCQIIALADPAEEWDLSRWYYTGKSGRGPVKAEIEEHYSGKTPNYACATYEDFRVMLEKEKAIDAVLIATPDHLHVYASILAMKSGKHVYCEKPLTHNIREARLVARVAKETGVATQMGNHGRSSEGHRQTVEWITDGAIGPVREVHAWSGDRGRPRTPVRARGRPSSPQASTGTFGLAHGLNGLTAGSTPRSSGDGYGTSVTAACPTCRRTISIRRSMRSASTRQSQWRPGLRSSIRRRTGEATLSHISTARRETEARSRCTGTTMASGRPHRSASIRTTRCNGSARATTGS